MSKITVLEQKTFEGKPSGFKVTLEDGRTGNLQEKESDKGLRVGDDVIVTEIPYTSRAGKKSTLYGLRLAQGGAVVPTVTPSTPQPKPTSSFVPANVQQLKGQATIKAMEFMINCFIADKITWDQIKEKHKELTGYLNDGIDECNS